MNSNLKRTLAILAIFVVVVIGASYLTYKFTKSTVPPTVVKIVPVPVEVKSAPIEIHDTTTKRKYVYIPMQADSDLVDILLTQRDSLAHKLDSMNVERWGVLDTAIKRQDSLIITSKDSLIERKVSLVERTDSIYFKHNCLNDDWVGTVKQSPIKFDIPERINYVPFEVQRSWLESPVTWGITSFIVGVLVTVVIVK